MRLKPSRSRNSRASLRRLSAGALEFLLEPLDEMLAVGHAGERVVVGQPADLLFVLLSRVMSRTTAIT